MLPPAYTMGVTGRQGADVKKRRDNQRLVGTVNAVTQKENESPEQNILMSQHRAFRVACRAGCVHDKQRSFKSIHG